MPGPRRHPSALWHLLLGFLVERGLAHALHLYSDLLYTFNRTRTLESLEAFHFAFRQRRLALGPYDPAGWREQDSDPQQMILVGWTPSRRW